MLSKETLQDLALKNETLIKSHAWWEKKIMETAMELDRLCTRDNCEDYPLIEKVQQDLEFWKKRGELEEKTYKDFVTSSHKMLINNLLSGASSMNLKY